MRRTLFVLVTLVVATIGRPPAVAAPQGAAKATPPAKAAAPAPAAGPTLVIETTKGAIEIAITEADAPKHAARVLELVKSNFYRGQRFHWVEPGVVQFGDPFSRDMTKQQSWGSGGSGPGNSNRPIGVAEPSKKPFVRGSVGVAYLKDRKPESADGQIFIMRFPNPALNGKYAQIGRVTKGLDVLDKIERADIVRLVTLR